MYGLDVFYDPLVTDVQVDGAARARHPGRPPRRRPHLVPPPPVRQRRGDDRRRGRGRHPRRAGCRAHRAAAGARRAHRHLDPRPHRRRPPRLERPPRARPARPGGHDGRRRARASTGRGSPTSGCARCGGRRHERAGAGARVAQRRPRDPGRAASQAGGDRARRGPRAARGRQGGQPGRAPRPPPAPTSPWSGASATTRAARPTWPAWRRAASTSTGGARRAPGCRPGTRSSRCPTTARTRSS